jgi:hypothetical protein
VNGDAIIAIACGLAGLVFVLIGFGPHITPNHPDPQPPLRCVHGFPALYCWECEKAMYSANRRSRCEHGVIGGIGCKRCIYPDTRGL